MEEDDIAAAMGFSSFGAQKRKFEDRILPQDAESSSGANSEPLGVRPRMGSQAISGEAETEDRMEIDNEDNVDIEEAGTLSSGTKSSKPKGNKKNKAPTTSSLADFLTRGKYLDEHAPAKEVSQEAPRVPQEAPEAAQSDNQSSARVQRAENIYTFPGRTLTESQLRDLASGKVTNERGDVVIFLPSFIDPDPWKELNIQEEEEDLNIPEQVEDLNIQEQDEGLNIPKQDGAT